PSAEHPGGLPGLANHTAAPGAGLRDAQRPHRGLDPKADLCRLPGPARRRADGPGLVAQPRGPRAAELLPDQPGHRHRGVDGRVADAGAAVRVRHAQPRSGGCRIAAEAAPTRWWPEPRWRRTEALVRCAAPAGWRCSGRPGSRRWLAGTAG